MFGLIGHQLCCNVGSHMDSRAGSPCDQDTRQARKLHTFVSGLANHGREGVAKLCAVTE